MRSESLLSRLERHQAETLAVLDRAARLLDGDPAVARAGLATLRWELARRLREYQTFKHGEIFEPAIASGSPSLAAAGRRLKADCIAGGESFQRYVREWSGRDVAADWTAFRVATVVLGTALRDHINAEGVQIRLLLAESDKARLAA